MAVKLILLLMFFSPVANCQGPELSHISNALSNNSYIDYDKISDGGAAITCMTNNTICCNSSIGNWSDWRGIPVQEGADVDTCLYVTRGDREINLNRKRGCTDHTSGLWRCDIPDSSGEMQSLYVYISSDLNNGELKLHMNSVKNT